MNWTLPGEAGAPIRCSSCRAQPTATSGPPPWVKIDHGMSCPVLRARLVRVGQAGPFGMVVLPVHQQRGYRPAGQDRGPVPAVKDRGGYDEQGRLADAEVDPFHQGIRAYRRVDLRRLR